MGCAAGSLGSQTFDLMLVKILIVGIDAVTAPLLWPILAPLACQSGLLRQACAKCAARLGATVAGLDHDVGRSICVPLALDHPNLLSWFNSDASDWMEPLHRRGRDRCDGYGGACFVPVVARMADPYPGFVAPISPWVLGFTDTTPLHWNSLSTGIIVGIFSATALVSGFDTRNTT